MLVAFFHLHAKSILHANGYGGVLEKKKERKNCLAEGEKRLAAFLVVQERPVCGWWQQRRWRCDGYSGAKKSSEGGEKN